MKTYLIRSMIACVLLVVPVTEMSAQGLLSKLSKAVDKVAGTKGNKSTTTTDSSLAEGDSAAAPDGEEENDSTTIDWDAIPVYHLQIVNETNADGTPALNADGTPITRVMLVDQFGNYRSQEAVEAQRKSLKKYIGTIIAKVGGGAALGAVTGLLAGGKKNRGAGAAIGAAAGAVAGVLFSLGDIKRATAINKSLKAQDKMMETYRKNFTNEGVPIDAAANVESIEGLDIDKDTAVSKTADEIKAIVDNDTFNMPDTSIWDSI